MADLGELEAKVRVLEDIEAIKKLVATAHGGHSPEIEITGDSTARGIWALQDYLVWESGRKLVGFGHYEDEYVKVHDQWRKKSLKLTRTFEEWTITKR